MIIKTIVAEGETRRWVRSDLISLNTSLGQSIVYILKCIN